MCLVDSYFYKERKQTYNFDFVGFSGITCIFW